MIDAERHPDLAAQYGIMRHRLFSLWRTARRRRL